MPRSRGPHFSADLRSRSWRSTALGNGSKRTEEVSGHQFEKAAYETFSETTIMSGTAAFEDAMSADGDNSMIKHFEVACYSVWSRILFLVWRIKFQSL